RLLAAVYRQSFGSRIESTVTCSACREPFDLDFSLDALAASLRPETSPPGVEREGGGIFRLSDQRRFRLPTGADEVAVVGLEAAAAQQELLRRCLIEGSAGDDPDAVLAAMQAVAPLCDLDLDARCPSCENPQQVHFDLQQFLLGSILEERRLRVLEIHRIAR